MPQDDAEPVEDDAETGAPSTPGLSLGRPAPRHAPAMRGPQYAVVLKLHGRAAAQDLRAEWAKTRRKA